MRRAHRMCLHGYIDHHILNDTYLSHTIYNILIYYAYGKYQYMLFEYALVFKCRHLNYMGTNDQLVFGNWVQYFHKNKS